MTVTEDVLRITSFCALKSAPAGRRLRLGYPVLVGYQQLGQSDLRKLKGTEGGGGGKVEPPGFHYLTLLASSKLT